MNTQRIKQLQAILEHPLLIKKKENLLYLTGRSFMHGYLLVRPRKGAEFNAERRGKKTVVFFGDGLEKPLGIYSDILKNIGIYLGRAKTLELEDEFTFAEYDYIKRKARSEKHKVKIRHVKSPVDFERTIKDKAEIDSIRKSMWIVGQVFARVKKQLKRKPWTEVGLAKFIVSEGRRLGADEISFPPIVASGANAAIPHHVPTNKKLKAGESIILDFGFKYQGYCSDFTRTVFIKKVSAKLEQAYNQVEKAYWEAIDFINQAEKEDGPLGLPQRAVLKGVRAESAYQKAVDVLAEKRLEKYFIHSLGHGCGLEIHELPNLSPHSRDILREGMVFSVEPGVYLPGSGGVRIEDLVYLEKEGAKKFIDVPAKLADNII